MLALAFDCALRRGELCSVATGDFDPAHRTVTIRAETTKTERGRCLPYSPETGTSPSAVAREWCADLSFFPPQLATAERPSYSGPGRRSCRVWPCGPRSQDFPPIVSVSFAYRFGGHRLGGARDRDVRCAPEYSEDLDLHSPQRRRLFCQISTGDSGFDGPGAGCFFARPTITDFPRFTFAVAAFDVDHASAPSDLVANHAAKFIDF